MVTPKKPLENIVARATPYEYEDEDPRIRELFAAELAKVGLDPRMPAIKK